MPGAGLRAESAPRAGAARGRRAVAVDPPAALVVRGMRAAYGQTTVLHGLDLDVRAGTLVTLLGANGSGKSTALRCLAGLQPVQAGTLQLEGVPLAGSRSNERRRVAMVFQAPQLVKRLSVLDNVCTGALGRLSLRLSASRLLFPTALREEAMGCLERVGLADRAADRAGRLSGGQQQRVSIARALCQRAPLLLADEPVSALDPASAEQVLRLLVDLAHRDGLAVLAVLHQPELARQYSDRIVGLMDGKAIFDLPAARVKASTAAALYARPTVPA